MKKINVSIILGIVLLFYFSISILAANIEIVGPVNVRSGPGTDFEIIKTVNSGEKYKLIKTKQDWHKIIIKDGQEGWIHKTFGIILWENEIDGTKQSNNIQWSKEAIKMAEKDIEWARETIKGSDRLKEIIYILISIFGIIIGILGVLSGIFGTKWLSKIYHEHRQMVEEHKKMNALFERGEAEALRLVQELDLPPFGIEIFSEEQRQEIEKRLEQLQGKSRPVEDIDQRVTSLEFFPVELEPKIFILLGHYYRYKGNFERAFSRYRSAVERDEDNAAAQYNLGWALLRLGRYPEALARLNKSIEINEKNNEFNFEPYFCKGVVLDELGKYKEAIENYEKSYDLKKDYFWNTYNKVCSLVRWGDEHKERKQEKEETEKKGLAIKELKKIIHIDVVKAKAKDDGELNGLRKHPKFARILKQMLET